ncbi:carbon storage regulator CsrA [Pseudomonas qingdaonensis]|uniref:Translational regulator CsrA n=1 Tax=Pseudomonas qingdaonensis TaxID=2056231 RepID=A0ABX8DV46_9PSED|nr:carbon storage regulator CsrA [Pseudomonas qingdaonensis]
MLILSRHAGESIQIGDSVTVVVLGIKGNQVRLAIEAPKGIAVDRQEIAVRKAAGIPRPNAPAPTPPDEPEPLYANRTETEWRQLLADEQAEREAQPTGVSHDAA